MSGGRVEDEDPLGLEQQVRDATQKLERELISRAMLDAGDDLEKAARLLKISLRELELKIKELGI